jgi:hypothetical protein
MNYRMLAEANEELRAAARYYETRRSGLGGEFLDEFERTMTDVVRSPLRFARIPTRGIEFELRQSIVDRFPYSVISYEKADWIVVIAVAHHKRRPRYWRR